MLGEDLPLVLGQQERLKRGGDTWNFPVSYDKIAVRYRRWRNSVAAGDFGDEEARSLPQTMSAGELFAIEDAPEVGTEEGGSDTDYDSSCDVKDEWKQ